MAYTPIPLKTQCLEVFGSFLYEQMALLIDIYQDPSIKNTTFRSQYLEPLRRSLECYVLANVKFSESRSSVLNNNIFTPCKDMGNKYTKTVLKQVLNSLVTLKRQYDGMEQHSSVKEDLLLMCEQVAAVIGASVYHPTSTKLDLFKQYDYISSSKIPKVFSTTFLEKASFKMNNLISFKLRSNLDGTMILSIVLKDMQNLRVFSCRNFCQDFTIFNLALYCKQLTILDVRNSKEVTDKSISHILDFKKLKSLQIIGTGLSSEGITQIIEVLRRLENPLNFFSESPLKYEDAFFERESITSLGLDLMISNITILRNNFINLRSLQLNLRENLCLSDLRILNPVTELDLGIDMSSHQFQDTEFRELKNLLVTLGPILYKLVLREVFKDWNDLQSILRRCVSLQYIELEYNSQNLHQISASMHQFAVMEDNVFGSDLLLRITPLFGYIRQWKLSGLIWRSDVLIVNVGYMAERKTLKRMKINEYDMKFEGSLVNISSLFGFRLSFEVCHFEPILKEILHNAEQLVILLTFLDG